MRKYILFLLLSISLFAQGTQWSNYPRVTSVISTDIIVLSRSLAMKSFTFSSLVTSIRLTTDTAYVRINRQNTIKKDWTFDSTATFGYTVFRNQASFKSFISLSDLLTGEPRSFFYDYPTRHLIAQGNPSTDQDTIVYASDVRKMIDTMNVIISDTSKRAYHLIGGNPFRIPFQIAKDTTGFIAAPDSVGQVLTYSGSVMIWKKPGSSIADTNKYSTHWWSISAFRKKGDHDSLSTLDERNFSSLTNKPTTILGYGITDPIVITSRSISTSLPLTGGGDLSTDRTISIASGSITGVYIQDATITGSKIGTATITGSNIASGTITSSNIADGTITGTDIGTATITGTNIAFATISGGNITDLTISAADIQNLTITAGKIANATITGAKIESATITGGLIANATIGGSNIAGGTISGSNIAGATITGANIAAATITGSNISNSTITGGLIDNATITGAKIAATTITASNIAANTITSSQIAAGTITATQIASGTITATNIATGTITATQIAVGTITTSQLSFTPVLGTSVISSINSSTEGIIINANKLTLTGLLQVGGAAADINSGSTTINGGKLTTSSVAADRLNVTSLSAINANLGNVTAGTLTGVTITGGTIQTSLSGQRISISGDDNDIKTYNSGGTLVGIIRGYALANGFSVSAASGIPLWLGGNTVEINSKFIINSIGQLTTVNNITAAGNTGKALISDGTSFTPGNVIVSISRGSANATYYVATSSGGTANVPIYLHAITVNGTTTLGYALFDN
jgi:uncharacterized protein YjbI with pentapeptide repeats